MALVGARYIQSNDPGAVGAGYQWLDTTSGDLYERNTTNSGWVTLYNVNQTNGGLLPLTGGNLSGSITGATGFATVDSPNFTTAAKLEGVNLATTRDLDNLQEQLSGEIDQKVSSSITALVGGQNANVAVGTGSFTKAASAWGTGETIPLPVFSDGTTATESQCKWMVALVRTGDRDDGVTTSSRGMYVSQVSGRQYKIAWFCTDSGLIGPSDTSITVGFSYIIVATR